MKDVLRAKIDVILAAAVAFAAGLGVAGELELAPESRAAGVGSPPRLQLGAPEELVRRLEGSDFRAGFAEVAQHLSGAVVTIFVDRKVDEARLRSPHRVPRPFDEFFDDREEDRRPRIVPGSGSGFLISRDGYVVTNNHVVEDAESITVALADQREFADVRVVGRDPTTDVALLKIEASGLQAAPLGRSRTLQVGDWVLAIGSPGFGGGDILPSTVTAGIVSAKGRSIGILGRRFSSRDQPNLAIEDFIQTDAVINRGNSGGPLVNARGEVVGMSTAIMSENGFYQGYGFAVPIDLVREVIDDLMEHGEVRRAVLGVLVEEVSPADARFYGLDRIGGAKVSDFSHESAPARRAGIEPGDVIVAVDGNAVNSVSELQRKIRAFDPGETVRLSVVHRGDREREELAVRLGAAESPARKRPPPSRSEGPSDPLGVEVVDLSAELRREIEERVDRELPDELTGVVVVGARRRGHLLRAAGGSLGRNPVIEDVNGEEIGGEAEYRDAISRLDPGDVANVRVYLPDLGQRRFLSVEIPER